MSSFLFFCLSPKIKFVLYLAEDLESTRNDAKRDLSKCCHCCCHVRSGANDGEAKNRKAKGKVTAARRQPQLHTLTRRGGGKKSADHEENGAEGEKHSPDC